MQVSDAQGICFLYQMQLFLTVNSTCISIPVHNHRVKEYTFLISLTPPPWVMQVSKCHLMPRSVPRERHSTWTPAPEVCGAWGSFITLPGCHAQPFSLGSCLCPRTLLGTGGPAAPGCRPLSWPHVPCLSKPRILSVPRSPLLSFTSLASLLCSPKILHFGNKGLRKLGPGHKSPPRR